MNYKILKFNILGILLLLVLLPNMVRAQGKILFAPNIAVVSVGETFEINIALDVEVVDLFAYTTHLKYDSSLIRIIDAYPTSDWLSLSGTSQYFVGADSLEIDPLTSDSNWYYHVFDVLFTTPKTTIDGFVEIATIKFTAKQSGISPLYFEFFKGSDTLLNSIISSSGEADIYICPLSILSGDVDGSGELNIIDLTSLVRYMFKFGDPPVPIILAGDMNCDLTVNILDLTYFVKFMFKNGQPPCDHCL